MITCPRCSAQGAVTKVWRHPLDPAGDGYHCLMCDHWFLRYDGTEHYRDEDERHRSTLDNLRRKHEKAR